MRWEDIYNLGNVETWSLSLALWPIFLLPWDVRCIKVLHISASNALPCKHQREFSSWTRDDHDTNYKSDQPQEALAPPQESTDPGPSVTTWPPTLTVTPTPASYPLPGLRLPAATTLTYSHICTPTCLSFRLVNTTSSKYIYLPRIFTTCHNIPDAVGWKCFVAIEAFIHCSIYVSPWSFSGTNFAISNSPVLSQSQSQSQIRHSSSCCMWHVFPVISFPSLTITAIV